MCIKTGIADASKDACLCIGEKEHIRETPMVLSAAPQEARPQPAGA